MIKRLALGAILVLLIGAGIFAAYQFQRSEAQTGFQGWVEADLVFVSPDEMGRIVTLYVREGATVESGSPLFTLDNDLQRAAFAETEAAVTNAKQDYDRAQVLLNRAVGSQKTFDDAAALLRSAEAKRDSAKTKLDRRKMFSPAPGTIQEVYFRQGETVQPGTPVVSILPPQNVKVRFFVPQALLPTLKIGDLVHVGCDGCRTDISARISFISAQAEFTPPVIYSLEERARLVFRIEAIPELPLDLRIGQPATVSLLGGQPSEAAHARK